MGTEVLIPNEDSHQTRPLYDDKSARGGEDISLIDLAIIIAQRKRIVLRTMIVVVVLAVMISLILPVRYTATSTILAPQQSSSTGAALASQLGNLGGVAALAGGSLGIKNTNEMLVSMMKSRTVEDAMVQRFELMHEYHARFSSDARKELEDRTLIDGSGKDGMIRISIKDHDPGRAAELVNGYVEQFRNLSDHLAITEASQRRLFFERQLQEAKDNLAKSEEQLKQTEQKTGLIQLDGQARALIESAASLRAQITGKEVQIQSLRTFATDQNDQVVQAQQELEGLRAQLSKLGGSETGSEANIIVPRGNVSQAGMEYVRRLRDVKYYETIFEILARQFEMAKLDEAKEGALIQVVDPAVPPDRRSFPKRGYIVLGSVAGGFLLGILVALTQAAIERLRTPGEMQKKIKLLFYYLSFRKAAN